MVYAWLSFHRNDYTALFVSSLDKLWLRPKRRYSSSSQLPSVLQALNYVLWELWTHGDCEYKNWKLNEGFTFWVLFRFRFYFHWLHLLLFFFVVCVWWSCPTPGYHHNTTLHQGWVMSSTITPQIMGCRFVSWNVRGVNGAIKRGKVILHFKQLKGDIYFLQETHLRSSEILLYVLKNPGWVMHFILSLLQGREGWLLSSVKM